YSKLYVDRYPELEEFFLEEDSKGRASLEGEGVLYYHLLKCREGGSNYKDIFAERLFKVEKKENNSSFSLPKLDKGGIVPEPHFDAVKFNTNPTDAFGGDEEDDTEDRPF